MQRICSPALFAIVAIAGSSQLLRQNRPQVRNPPLDPAEANRIAASVDAADANSSLQEVPQGISKTV